MSDIETVNYFRMGCPLVCCRYLPLPLIYTCICSGHEDTLAVRIRLTFDALPLEYGEMDKSVFSLALLFFCTTRQFSEGKICVHKGRSSCLLKITIQDCVNVIRGRAYQKQPPPQGL